MKKFTKLLAIVLTVVLTASTVLSVPFNVIAKEDPNNLIALWADEYAFFTTNYDFKVNDSQYAQHYPTDGHYNSSTHKQLQTKGDYVSQRLSNSDSKLVLQSYSDIAQNGFLNVNDRSSLTTSKGLPYVTYTLIAPEDGVYAFEHIVDFGLGDNSSMPSGGYFITYCVNDNTTYRDTVFTGTPGGGGSYIHDKLELKLVKGVNFVRVITHGADFAGSLIWVDMHGAWVDNRLTAIKDSEMVDYTFGNLRDSAYTKYVFWPARDTNRPKLLHDTNLAKGWNPTDSTAYDSIDPSDFVVGKYEVTGSAGSYSYYTPAGAIPFMSKTIYVPVAGYYQLEYHYNFDTTCPHTSANDAYFPFFVSDPATGKYTKYKKYFRSDGNGSYGNLSVYLTEGENVITLCAPYAKTTFNWLNISTLAIIGIPGTKEYGISNQRDPSKITTYSGDINAPEYEPASTESSWIYASTHATLTGIEKNGKTLSVNNSANRITPNGANISGTGVAGWLSSVYQITDMQTVKSMQSEGYLNKTHLPIVTYHISVDKAGTYELQTVYEAAIREDYSYEDFFIVVSANDNEFIKAYFDHADTASCEICTNDGTNAGNFPNGGGLEHNGYNMSHHSISTVKVNLEAGQNIIRCILAVGETAPSLNWIDFEAIKLKGPSVASAVTPSNEKVSPATQASVTCYQSSSFTESKDAAIIEYAGEKKLYGHTHTEWPKYGLYDETLHIGEINRFSSFSIKVYAPRTGYFDIGLLFRYGIKNYKGKHAVFIDGYKHFYYAQDNTSYIYKNMMNLSMYLEAGDHIITVTCPTDYKYVNRIAADGVNVENNWTDFGNMYLYGGLTYEGSPTTDEVMTQVVSEGRLEAEHFAYANEISQTRQLNTSSSGNAIVGAGYWDNQYAQEFKYLDDYLDASNMRYVTFMVEAPSDGKYTITPGYALNVPTENYYLTILVNGGAAVNGTPQVIQSFFKGRKTTRNATNTNVNDNPVEVTLVKGTNTITLLQGVYKDGVLNHESKHNGTTPAGTHYLNFDYLDISDGLVGIPIHYDYDWRASGDVSVTPANSSSSGYIEEFLYYEYEWTDGSDVDVISPESDDAAIYKNKYAKGTANMYGKATQSYSTNNGSNTAWIVDDTVYTNGVLTNASSYKADSLSPSVLSNVPYISFKVKAEKDGYYQIISHFDYDDSKLEFYHENQPFYISALIDGKARAVGFEENSSTWEFGQIANNTAFHSRISFVPYLTAGEHIITLTAPLNHSNPIYSPRNSSTNAAQKNADYAVRLNYDNIYLLGGLKLVSSAPTQSEILNIVSNTNGGSFNGCLSSDEEAFYAARGSASSAAAAIKNYYQYSPDTFEDSDTVDQLVLTAIQTIQRTEYAGEGGSYDGKSYQEYFDAIIADLKQDVIAQKQLEFDAYKQTKLDEANAYIDANYANTGEYDADELKLIRDVVAQMFEKTTYDTTQPVTTSVKKIESLSLNIKTNIDQMIEDYNDFEEYRKTCHDEYAPGVKVTVDPWGINDVYKEPQSVLDAIETAKQDIMDYVYDFGLDLDTNKSTLQENKDTLYTIITALDTKATQLRTARYYQSGTWVQYQVAKEVKDFAYVRLFFEIDKKNNDYLDYGFYFSFKDSEYSLPNDIYKMSFYNTDVTKDHALEQIKAQTKRDKNGDLIEEYYLPYMYDLSTPASATHFVFVYFIIPVDMFGIDYYFQAYTRDANGEYLGKMKMLDLDTKYASVLQNKE